jgi:transcription-repair coupling factor (superfamily II helicase)
VPVSELASKLAQADSIEAMINAASGIRPRRPLQISGLPAPARIASIATLARTLRIPILMIVSRQDVAEQLAGALDEYLGDESTVRLWPTSDALPYEMVPVDRDASARRIEILESLQHRDSGVTIVSARGLTQYLISQE